MGYIDLEGAVMVGNGGNGITIIGDGKVNARGAVIAHNGGDAVFQRDATLVEKLGLPAETDPKELALLLALLIDKPAADRVEVVKASGLFGKIKALVLDGTTLANNIAGLASNPNVSQWIQMLSD